MTLFKWGTFTSSAGIRLDWKIECDALTKEDWQCIARASVHELPNFGIVIGVPRGGLELAAAFREFAVPESSRVLVVDDVWTTGKSIMTMGSQFRQLDWVCGFRSGAGRAASACVCSYQ